MELGALTLPQIGSTVLSNPDSSGAIGYRLMLSRLLLPGLMLPRLMLPRMWLSWLCCPGCAVQAVAARAVAAWAVGAQAVAAQAAVRPSPSRAPLTISTSLEGSLFLVPSLPSLGLPSTPLPVCLLFEGTGLGSGHPQIKFSTQRRFTCPRGTESRE